MQTQSILHSSRLVAAQLYQTQARKPLPLQHSPYFKQQHSPKGQILRQSNTSSKGMIKIDQKKSSPFLNAHKSPVKQQLNNPQKGSHSSTNSLRQYKSTLSQQLQKQKAKFHQLRSLSKKCDMESKRQKAAKERIQTRQQQRMAQQIQYKRKQLSRDQEVRLNRKASERSFVLETRKQTIDMLKQSRQIRSRSELKMARQQRKETQREHQFLVLKNKTSYLQKNYQLKYHKAFIKCQPFKKYVYPNLTSTLAIASKAINSPNTKVKNLPKIQKAPKVKQQNNKQTLEPLSTKTQNKPKQLGDTVHSVQPPHQQKKQAALQLIGNYQTSNAAQPQQQRKQETKADLALAETVVVATISPQPQITAEKVEQQNGSAQI